MEDLNQMQSLITPYSKCPRYNDTIKKITYTKNQENYSLNKTEMNQMLELPDKNFNSHQKKVSTITNMLETNKKLNLSKKKKKKRI